MIRGSEGGEIRCACRSVSPRQCWRLRYSAEPDGDGCACGCHIDEDSDEVYLAHEQVEALDGWRSLNADERGNAMDELTVQRDALGHAGRDVHDLDMALRLLQVMGR